MPGELSPDIKSFFWTPPHPMSEDCLQIVTSGWVPRPECPSPWGTKPLLEAPSPYPNRCKLKCEFLNWRTVDLQCSVSFCCTTKWCSYIYISLNSFSYSFPLWFLTAYQVLFPVLHSRPLLLKCEFFWRRRSNLIESNRRKYGERMLWAHVQVCQQSSWPSEQDHGAQVS